VTARGGRKQFKGKDKFKKQLRRLNLNSFRVSESKGLYVRAMKKGYIRTSKARKKEK